ncbi:MAG TPA: phosphoribosyl-ATP diphosphatase [Clostridiales bacterium]|jgi:phosphoribosyl-ATP pyrophosphohydrolase|nr:phosphoribosyl-ATP diphosphatase [Clostridiales bacterium]
MDILKQLYDMALERRKNPAEGSYTCYLFEQGIDKICKKIGEESAETIIAAKNGSPDELTNEISDLIYHLAVLMAEARVSYDDVRAELERRSQKTGNLKTSKKVDKNT